MKTFARILIATGTVVSAWFAALVIEAATRLMASLFVQFGADLPSPTILTIDAVKSYMPWLVAVASTVVILYLWWRGSRHLPYACAAVAGVVSVLACTALLALSMPLMKCGISWPQWPAAIMESAKPGAAPNVALRSDASQGAPAVSCR